MEKFNYWVHHDYEIFPTKVEIEAEDQFDALKKLSDKLESKNVIGRILSIQLIK